MGITNALVESEDSISRQVVRFVARMTNIKVEKLSSHSRLNYDLGVDGDDADELLLAFKNHFHVDLARLVFSDYFGPEPNLFTPFVWIWRLLFPVAPRKPLTIADLVDAAERKQWSNRAG